MSFKQKLVGFFQPVALGADFSTAVIKCPFAGVIESVSIVPNAALAGANTNTRKHEVINAGAAGAGTAVAASLQYNSGISLTAFDEKALTNGVLADRTVAADDILKIASTHVGTGLADGGGMIIVVLARN